MLTLPQQFEELLKAYVKETYYRSTRKKDFATRNFTEGDYRFFMTGVAKMSDFFTVNRKSLPRNYFNRKELRSGYLLYFLPINALKIAALAKTLPKNFFKKSRRILDLGSGPATASIGTLLHMGLDKSMVPPQISLVDQNRSILKEGAKIISMMAQRGICKKPQSIQLIVSDLVKTGIRQLGTEEPYDLIILSNLLNEIRGLDRRLRLISQLIKKKLTPQGRLLIVEPALRQQTRELMELRDRIAERELAFIEAPCLHQEACPMYADNRRDWCHMYWNWKRPALIERMDRLVGIRKDYLKASYLMLGGRGKPPCLPLTEGGHRGPPLHNIWRVVSGPLNSRGKSERLLCGPQGLPHLQRLMRLDRNCSKINQDFDRAMRGDVVKTDAREKLGKGDRFVVLPSVSSGP